MEWWKLPKRTLLEVMVLFNNAEVAGKARSAISVRCETPSQLGFSVACMLQDAMWAPTKAWEWDERLVPDSYADEYGVVWTEWDDGFIPQH